MATSSSFAINASRSIRREDPARIKNILNAALASSVLWTALTSLVGLVGRRLLIKHIGYTEMPSSATVSSEAEKAKLTGNDLFAKGKLNAAIEVIATHSPPTLFPFVLAQEDAVLVSSFVWIILAQPRRRGSASRTVH